MIIGAALYTYALKPASLLSLTLQDDNIDMVQTIKHILKSNSSLKKSTSQNLVKWPVTKIVLSKLKDENGGKVYQGLELPYSTKLWWEKTLVELELQENWQRKLWLVGRGKAHSIFQLTRPHNFLAGKTLAD